MSAAGTRRRPNGVIAYVTAIAAAAILLVLATLPGFPSGRWPDLLLFITFATLAEMWTVPTNVESSMSLSFVIDYGAAVLFGPAFAAITAAAGGFLSDGVVRHRQGSVVRTAFNVGQFAVSAALSGLVFQWLRRGTGVSLTGDALALAACALTYLVVNNTLVTGVLSLNGRSFAHEWTVTFREVGILYVSMAPLGALFAHSYHESRWTVLYFPLLIVVIYNGFKLYVNLQQETDNALVALADTVDKRDRYTYQHSIRVARIAEEIARTMNLPAKEIDLIISAARVHDLGKISTDNRILYKQASLTDEERALINAHPAAGGELAGKFSMYRKGRDYIRHHHERWDGKGYPDGLVGESIPLGARVIAVADAYDAMTSDRPYRKALSHDIAVAELRRGVGKQFDPAVVAAFVGTPAKALAGRARVQATAAQASR